MIGIYGAFKPGNFGDDLMAILFADVVKKLNKDVLVYGLDDGLAKKYGFKSTNSLNFFLSNVSKVAMCTGGMLCVSSESKGYPAIFVEELNSVTNFLKKNNIPYAFFSIGGNGVNDYGPEIENSLRSSVLGFSTVRLKSDLADGNIKSINAKWFNDVVLAVGNLYPKSVSGHNVVAFNLTKRVGRALLPLIVLMAYVTGKDVVFVSTHSKTEYCGDYLPSNRISDFFSRVRTYRCYDPLLDLDAISKWEAIVSGKLHLGMAAFAYGAYFVTSMNNKKVYSFFKENDMEQRLYSGKISLLLNCIMIFFKKRNLDVHGYENSVEHLKALATFVES